MSANNLTATEKPVSAGFGYQNVRLFACFERSELVFLTCELPSFTETTQTHTRKWELVDAAWFSTVRTIIERSLPAPKSLEKLSAVIDLYDRARAASGRVTGIHHTGPGGVWGGSEADQREVELVERRVADWLESWWGDLSGDPWAAAEAAERKAGIELPENPRRGRRDFGASGDFLADGMKIPEVGLVVNLKRRIESFAGPIPPGPATVTGAGVDEFGEVVVSLARGGLTVASGVVWSELEA